MAAPRLPQLQPHQRIGLYGGSFNPVHAGHKQVAATALRAGRLDRLVWLVSPQNPLKNPVETAAYDQRLQAVKRAAHGPRQRVSDLEARLGIAYSYQTLRHLGRVHPDVQFVWVMGADSFAGLHRWRHWREIAQCVPFLVVARPGTERRATACPAALLLGRPRPAAAIAKCGRGWAFVRMPLSPLASSLIRKQRVTQ